MKHILINQITVTAALLASPFLVIAWTLFLVAVA